MRPRHRIAAALAGTALLAGSVYAVVTSDAFVRRMVRSVVGRVFRGPAHVDEASFSLRDGLVVRGVEVRDPDDPVGAPAVRVAELRAEFGLPSLGEGLRVRRVVLARPSLRVRRLADGTLSAASLLAPVPDEPQGRLELFPVEVEQATLEYDDPTLVDGGAIVLTDFRAAIVPTGDAWRCTFSGRSQDLGRIEGQAFVTPEREVTGHVDLLELPLDAGTLRRAKVTGVAPVANLSGRGTAKGHAEIAWGPGHDLLVSARLDLAGWATRVELPAGDGAPAAPVDVEVLSGTAEYRGDEVTLRDLDVRVLGAAVRCAAARLTGLRSAAGAEIEADVRVDDLVLSDDLVARLPHVARRVVDAFGMRAKAAARARVRGPLAAPRIDVEADVSEGRVRYDGYVREGGVRTGFPWEATGVAGTVSFTGGNLLTFTVTGRHGPARLYAKGTLDYATGDELPDVTIVAEDVPLDADLRAAFQDRADRVFDRWGPSGTAARVDVRVVRDPHDDGPFGEAVEITLHLDGRATMRPRLLPMPLSDLRGRVQVLYPSRGDHRSERVVLRDVRARADGVAVRVDGRIETDREVASDDLVVEVHADDVGGALADAVRASEEIIPPAVKRVLDDLSPRGPADVRAEVAGDPDRRRDRVVVDARGISVRGYRDVPFAARDLAGRVVVEGDEVRFEGVAGTALGVPVRGEGRILGVSTGATEPDVVVEAVDLPLGPSLRKSLGPVGDTAAAFWDGLGPADAAPGAADGGTRADVRLVLRPSSDATPVELRLRRIRGPLRPGGLAFVLDDGELRFDGREATLRLDATLGPAQVSLDRARYDLATRRVEVAGDFVGLRFPEDVRPILGDATTDAIAAAVPGRIVDANGLRLVYDPGPERLDVSGELEVRPERPSEPRPPGLAPEGLVEVHRLTFWFPPGLPTAFDASFRAAGLDVRPGLQIEGLTGLVALAGRFEDDGVEMGARTRGARFRVSGLPVQDADVDARVGPSGPAVELRNATLHGGRLTARVSPGGRRVAYNGEVHLRNADLSRFGGGNNGATGQFSGDVLFRNPSGEPEDLRGSVELTVKEGDLVSFPVVSAILNLIPGAGKLTDAILSGSIEGRNLVVRDLVVRGPILSLTDGRGTIGLDGALDLTMNPGLPLTTVVVTGEIGKPRASLRLLSTGK